MSSYDDQVVQLFHRQNSLNDRYLRFVEKLDAGEYCSHLVEGHILDRIYCLRSRSHSHSLKHNPDDVIEKLRQYQQNKSFAPLLVSIFFFEQSLQTLTQELDALIKYAESQVMHHPSSNQQSSHSSPSSKSDESPSLSVTVDCPSSSTHVELPTLPTQTELPPSISSPEDLQSHSSSTLVENPSPPSTTVLVDLPLSSTTVTEETSTRRKQPTTYLQALIGTTT